MLSVVCAPPRGPRLEVRELDEARLVAAVTILTDERAHATVALPHGATDLRGLEEEGTVVLCGEVRGQSKEPPLVEQRTIAKDHEQSIRSTRINK